MAISAPTWQDIQSFLSIVESENADLDGAGIQCVRAYPSRKHRTNREGQALSRVRGSLTNCTSAYFIFRPPGLRKAPPRAHMSSDDEGDLDERPSSGDPTWMPVLVTPANQMDAASSSQSHQADWRQFQQQLLFIESHAIGVTLEAFNSVTPDMVDTIPRECTNLRAYLTCVRNNADGTITEDDLDLLISCATCVRRLYMVTLLKTQHLHEAVIRKSRMPHKQCNVTYTSLLEAVLLRATTADLPCFYGGTGSPAEFPCVNQDLCDCAIRPLYAAIYFSHAQVLSTLLRYGAEVRLEDTCRCEEPLCMHPLLRIYTTLAGVYHGRGNRPASVNVVRCQQLAALVMPCHDTALRNACYTLIKAFTPPEEYQTLLREKGSLRHLCRLSLRAALARRQAMPLGVEQLPLPKPLQRYILYQHGPGCL
ncbi:hypothetical protein HPB48_011689 [Haemaphysalis longicornis]|uniref:SOCS box domain-containing protein n=1 Tax=Haemaphysalis longicornis TaxID=44386 RepID=A0A9J6H6C7_HAELO|nr:hypothetical protein HPB48_011689 [Haemaphysalis longicornis]